MQQLGESLQTSMNLMHNIRPINPNLPKRMKAYFHKKRYMNKIPNNFANNMQILGKNLIILQFVNGKSSCSTLIKKGYFAAFSKEQIVDTCKHG